MAGQILAERTCLLCERTMFRHDAKAKACLTAHLTCMKVMRAYKSGRMKKYFALLKENRLVNIDSRPIGKFPMAYTSLEYMRELRKRTARRIELSGMYSH